jgi:hypothetical protein
LIFSQSVDRPDRYREDSRFDTTPSSPIRQTPWNMSSSVFCDSTIPRLRLPMSEESLPIREGERPQVLASELQQVEGVSIASLTTPRRWMSSKTAMPSPPHPTAKFHDDDELAEMIEAELARRKKEGWNQ